MQDIHTIIDALNLEPHPEGGFYKEMHRSKTTVQDLKGSRNKSAHTSIYYLLSGKDFSSWQLRNEITHVLFCCLHIITFRLYSLRQQIIQRLL